MEFTKKAYSTDEIFDELSADGFWGDVYSNKSKGICFIKSTTINEDEIRMDKKQSLIKNAIRDWATKGVFLFYERDDEKLEYIGECDTFEEDGEEVILNVYSKQSRLIEWFNGLTDVQNMQICSSYITYEGIKRVVDSIGKDVKYEIVYGENIGQKFEPEELGVDITLYHYTTDDVLFHPKFMIGHGEDRYWFTIGSANLTEKGLIANIEENIYYDELDSIEAIDFDEERFERYRRLSEKRDVIETDKELISNEFGNKIVVNSDVLSQYGRETKSAIQRLFKLVQSDAKSELYKATPNSVYREGDTNFEESLSILGDFISTSLCENIEKMNEEKEVLIKDGSQDGRSEIEPVGEEEEVRNIIKSLDTFSKENRVIASKKGNNIEVYNKHLSKFSGIGIKGELRNQLDVRVKDIRNKDDGDEINILWESDEIELWDFQKEWVSTILGEDSASKYEVEGPCGSGKTYTGIKVICELSKKTLILGPTKDVCSQWVTKLNKLTSVDKSEIAQVFGGRDRLHSEASIIVSTYANVSRKIKEFDAEDFGLIIYDESHSLRGDVWSRTKQITSDKKLGLSATALNSLENVSDPSFTPCEYNWDAVLDKTLEKGYIQIPSIYKHSDEVIQGGHEKGMESYEEKINLLQDVVEEENNPILAFVSRVENGHMIEDRFDSSEFIYGETDIDKREECYRKFEEGDIELLIVTSIADEGVNIPSASIEVMVSWIGGSPVQGTQRIGRVMRGTKEGEVIEDDDNKVIYLIVTSDEQETMCNHISHLKGKLEDELSVSEY